jgi:hypothetical protein
MISTVEAQRPAMIRATLEDLSTLAEPKGWTDASLVAWGPEGTFMLHTAAIVTPSGTRQSRWATVWLLLRLAARVLFMRGGER